MKIGLIFPNKDRKDKTVHIGLGYIASYARNIHPDVEFKLLDTRIAKKKEVKEFYSSHFDLIGITVLSPVYYEVIEIFNHIKTNIPDTPICLGGPYVTTIMEEIFNETPADFAVYGEGEITFSELIYNLKGKKEIECIDGLMYIDSTGTIRTNSPREQIKDLSKLPMPAYDLFHMNRYPMHRIATSRGCPFTCVFCNSSSIWKGKWRKRNAVEIVEEIKYLIKHHKKKTFFFNDNSFNIDMKRVEEFCNILIKEKLNIIWTTPVRVERITDEQAKLMKKAGCYNVGIGIESANNRILERMQKRNSIEEIQNGIKIFRNAGIEVLGQFVIGSHGDTLETIKESIDFAKSSELDYVMFYSILPFKDTQQWDYIKKEGKIYSETIHEYHSIKPRIVFETPEFSYIERMDAINLAKKAGYYSDSNDRSRFFDIGKDIARRFQELLPNSIGNNAYILMKRVYKYKLWKN